MRSAWRTRPSSGTPPAGSPAPAVALVGLVIAHVYFAVRPEKWWITKEMILGWITRRDYLQHHDPDRWRLRRPKAPSAAQP